MKLEQFLLVYGGQAMLMKVNPSNGEEIWTHTNTDSEYALAVVEDNNNNIYYGGTLYDDYLKLTKINNQGEEVYKRFRKYSGYNTS